MISPFQNPILVTRPYLPPIEEYKDGLAEIWRNQWLTNSGPFLQRFLSELATYLEVSSDRMSLLTNGTLALELIFHAMEFSGYEVITTPFTFVATAHALKRIGAVPVFADVNPETGCLSPASVEKLITSKTRGIVPVHVYGHPCDVDGLDRLAKKYELKVIYDAAHSFGVNIGGRSIAEYGDVSMFSFHSTKLFHSIEGGLLVFKDPILRRKVDQLKNFGIVSETECVDVGTNAKMNELQALMGLLCLQAVNQLMEQRKQIYQIYEEKLANNKHIKVMRKYAKLNGVPIGHNYAYCPILLPNFEQRENLYSRLKEYNIFSRRYFYPLLTQFYPYMNSSTETPLAQQIADRVLTLPTYHGLLSDDVEKICDILISLSDL